MKNEIDLAKNVLKDIRSVLRSDGASLAIEKKKAKMGEHENPIQNAKKLLESVMQKFKSEPEEKNLALMKMYRSQIDELSSIERDLDEKIDGLPEKIASFNEKIDNLDTILNNAEEKLKIPEISDEKSLENYEKILQENDLSKIEALKIMEDLSNQLIDLSESLPPQRLQEQEELILSKSAKCKAFIAKLDVQKKQRIIK